MNRHTVNSVSVLLAAGLVLAASVVFSRACSEVVSVGWVLVAEIRESREIATAKADAATIEVRRLREYLERLARFGEGAP